MESEALLKPKGNAAHTERTVQDACRAAKELEHKGDYEAAFEALAGFWPELTERPHTEGLSLADQAELLLRAGALAGWLSISRHVPDARHFAKELISESLRSFEELGLSEKIAEAQTDLAVCYWREGAIGDARAWFKTATQSEKSAPETEPRATFDQQVREFESTLLRQALEEANGSVTRAARALGLTHQGLCYIINHRHRSLLSARAPIRVRRKSLIKKHK